MTFRSRFTPRDKVKSALLHATTLGIYTLSINGKMVGNEHFAPGLTSYEHQIQYLSYDVTDHLHDTNELIAVVAGGWVSDD